MGGAPSGADPSALGPGRVRTNLRDTPSSLTVVTGSSPQPVLVLADLRRGGDGDSAADKIAYLESDPVTSQLTAVREERYIILDSTTMDPSIRNIAGIEQLADGLRELGVAQ
jgi:hypothetical protein